MEILKLIELELLVQLLEHKLLKLDLLEPKLLKLEVHKLVLLELLAFYDLELLELLE